MKRALIVTPTSLVSNWESEINKWLGGRVQLLSLCESTRADVLSGIDNFLKPCSRFQVISFESSSSYHCCCLRYLQVQMLHFWHCFLLLTVSIMCTYPSVLFFFSSFVKFLFVILA